MRRFPEQAGSVYELPSDYFATTARPFVRLSASYAVGGGRVAVLSPPLNLLAAAPAALTGALLLRGDGGAYGDVYTVDVSGLRDAAGNAPSADAFNYAWYYGAAAGARDFAAGGGRLGVSGTVYTLSGAVTATNDVSAVRRYLRVTVSHKSSGYEFAATSSEVYEATGEVPNKPTEGVVTYATTPGAGGRYASGTSFEVSTLGITDGNNIGEYSWHWFLQRSGGSSYLGPEVTSSGYTVNLSANPLQDPGVYELVAALAHRDAFGFPNINHTVTLEAISIPGIPNLPGVEVGVAFLVTMSLDQTPVGLPSAVLNIPSPLAADKASNAGAVYGVNVDGITDANDETTRGGTFAYQWLNGDGTSKSGENAATYTFTTVDYAAVTAGRIPPLVSVGYTDELGFSYSWTVTAQINVPELSLDTATREVSSRVGGNITVTAYQWQRGDANGVYTTDAAQTGATYTVPANVGTTPFLRLRVNYSTGGVGGVAFSSPLAVAGLRTPLAADSTIALTNITAGGVRAGAVWRATTNVRDIYGNAAGADDFAYQWQAGTSAAADDSSWRDVGGARGRGATYTVSAADFADATYLRLLATDAAGVSQRTLISSAENVRTLLAGVAIVGGKYLGGLLTVNASGLSDNNGPATIDGYQLQQGVALDVGGVTTIDWRDFSEGNSSGVFSLAVWYGDTSPLVRAAVTVRGAVIQGGTVIYSDGLSLNIPTDGTPRAVLADNAALTSKATVRVDISGLSDANDGADAAASFDEFRVRYLWLDANGTPLTEGVRGDTADKATYVLTADDVRNIENNAPLRVSVGYTDGLGFVSALTARFDAVWLEVGRNGAEVTSAVRDPNNLIVAGSEVYTWAQSAASRSVADGGRYTAIPNETGAVYTVQGGYDAARNYVRLIVNYKLAGDARLRRLESAAVAGGGACRRLARLDNKRGDEQRAGGRGLACVDAASARFVRQCAGRVDLSMAGGVRDERRRAKFGRQGDCKGNG